MHRWVPAGEATVRQIDAGGAGRTGGQIELGKTSEFLHKPVTTQAANDTARWLERLAADPDDDTTEAETARSATTEAQAEADRFTEATRTSTVETL